MELRVLGPVEASVDGTSIDLGAPRQRCVLAVLALEPNRIVPLERLIDAIWDEDAPPAAKSSIQAYISRLRKVFAPVEGVSLTGRAGGYRLDIAADAIDLHRFARLIDEARATSDPAAADRLFGDAMKLWRGSPLSDVRTTWLDQRVCAGLEQQHLDAIEDQYECRLRMGAHAESVSTLRGLVAEYPLREKLAGQLMLALYRSGQKAAALESYRQTAELIVDELGLDPGTELRQLHEAILRDDESIATPTKPEPTTKSDIVSAMDIEEPRSVVPAQLPGDVAAFTGREDELAQLSSLHRAGSGDHEQPGSGMRITAITGTAGVGKTSLALHWGHHTAAQFPDGALYINLRGFDDQQPPTEPTDALRQLLGGLGATPTTIPASLDERAALFRSMLAARDTLLVLDNARGSKQVRPLLPGTPRCHVLVTSRTRLDGLVALDGAHQISLDSLSPDESRQLLATIVGAERVDVDPDAVRQLAALCGHLPLGLRLAGAQLAAQEHRSIADFVEELTDYQDRLDTLDLLDLDTPLRATFDVSYQALSAEAAQVFRIIGLHPGSDVDTYAIAAATEAKPTRVRRWLDQLVNAHLVSEQTPGRYVMHDLLRAYALEKANDLPLSEQDQTTERMLDYYLHVAQTAKTIQYTGRSKPIERERPHYIPAETPPLTGIAKAGAWFDVEWANLIAAVRHSAARTEPRHAIAIPLAMSVHFTLTHRWDDALNIGRIARTTARKHGNHESERRILNLLASAAYSQEGPEQSITYFRQMHELAVAQGNHYSAGLALSNLSLALSRSGQYEEAVATAGQALGFISRHEDPWNWANTKNHLCTTYLRMGDPAEAVTHGMQALETFVEINDEVQQGLVLHSLGEAHLGLSRTDEARDYLERAIEVDLRTGNDRGLAQSYLHLGDLEDRLGHAEVALSHWELACTSRNTLLPHEAAQLDERLQRARQHLSPA